tara:strand:- start:151 stop:1041 length:891 start_codon:yes stop_codon:yes gene_type:complete
MQVRTVAVIGAGTMGSGIAQVCAQSGLQTKIFDAFPESLDKGMERIFSFWDKGIEKGKTRKNEKEEWSLNLKSCYEISEALENVDLVIEAVPEIMELKKEIFLKIDKLAPKHAILATNTSSLPISEIANVTNCPERVIGMHFFNPVPIMKLLELVKHEKCSEETIKLAQSIGLKIGKETILVNDVPGFATSRLGVIIGNEAIKMLSQGVASASDIDTAMKLGYKHPMGPLELSDLVGLDVRRDILNSLAESFNDESYRPHPLLNNLVLEGSLGKKTNKGIYIWDENGKKERDDLPR